MPNDRFEAMLHKHEITEVLYRYARGIDRMDRALALSCWHPGGTDRHGSAYSGSAEGFLDWVWPIHQAALFTRHIVTNICIQVDGPNAGSESYWSVTLRDRGEGGALFDTFGQGRYIDTFEHIDGVWAIRHRESIRDDWFWRIPVPDSSAPTFIKGDVPPQSAWARDPSDYSYSVLTGSK